MIRSYFCCCCMFNVDEQKSCFLIIVNCINNSPKLSAPQRVRKMKVRRTRERERARNKFIINWMYVYVYNTQLFMWYFYAESETGFLCHIHMSLIYILSVAWDGSNRTDVCRLNSCFVLFFCVFVPFVRVCVCVCVFNSPMKQC